MFNVSDTTCEDDRCPTLGCFDDNFPGGGRTSPASRSRPLWREPTQACTQGSEAGFWLAKVNPGEILTNMGLRPEGLNEKRYRMAIDRGGIKFSITPSISNDGSEIWLYL